MKKHKKIICILLSLIIIFTFIPSTVIFKAATPYSVEMLRTIGLYSATSDTANISYYDCALMLLASKNLQKSVLATTGDTIITNYKQITQSQASAISKYFGEHTEYELDSVLGGTVSSIPAGFGAITSNNSKVPSYMIYKCMFIGLGYFPGTNFSDDKASILEFAKKAGYSASSIVNKDACTYTDLANILYESLFLEMVSGGTLLKYMSDSNATLKKAVDDNGIFETHTPDAAINRILNNIENSNYIIGREKKDACRVMAKLLLEKGYEVSFVAGILANVTSEGAIGAFEGCIYTTHPENKKDYLYNIEEYYDYRNKYNNKYIYNVNLNDVYDMVTELEAMDNKVPIGQSADPNGGRRIGFGLGSIQWTFGRTYTLVKLYRKYANGSSSITKAQATQAECEMILTELENGYEDIYINWRNAYKSNLNSSAAAKEAGRVICYDYERPSSRETSQYTRATLAGNIFAELIK